MGVLGGQLIGDNVLIATGSPRYTYFVRAAVSAVHFAHNCLYMIETLPPEKRRPFAGYENPFNCFRVVTSMGPKLRWLVSIALLQLFTEGKHIVDIR